MATTLMYKCKCGIIYNIFLSKKAITSYMEQSREKIEAAEKIDKESDENREIEMAKRVARMTRMKFIDFRETHEFQCECGKKIDVNHAMENFCRA